MIYKKLLFILIGNDCTGKTTLQKFLIEQLCGIKYEKLPTNIGLDITHPEIKRKYSRISFGNRSYQEKINKYGNVDEYFEKHFNEQEIAFISSHLNKKHIEKMIINGHKRFYNVCGVFFTNSIKENLILNSEISTLNWDERLIIENPKVELNQINLQLKKIADNFTNFLINKTKIS